MTDDPPRRRLRRLIVQMLLLAALGIGGSLWWLHAQGVAMRLHFVVAIGLGVGLSLLLGGALMALVFHSNRSGHDERVIDLDER